jgi:type II secretory pathway pseudopilin PulG
VCEYWDPAKGKNVNRDYVVYLQHRVRQLELQVAARTDSDEGHEDAEVMVRSGAGVKLHEHDETKYLGPSSGTQMTRLIMQLAKHFTDSKSIKNIVNETKARQVKALYAQEADKPTSKIYPLTSDVAAEDLPNRGLTDLLVQLYNLKVQPMYPALHEPSFAKDVDAVYNGSPDPYQNYIVRMVVAISLQKMDTQYAGLADSYYLAALQYLNPVIRPMNLKTLQAFAMIAEYSLLTPTRTAIYYVIGLAVRLSQSLGINEERTITRTQTGAQADPLEVDMRRRLFWCTLVMELGLSHALGRPSTLATHQDHIDVDFFEPVADEYITADGILPGAPRPNLKKWIAIHFFKMRMLQLEIRRKLYQKKRATPKDDKDMWFLQMNAKLESWRDASPTKDEGSGLNKVWFIGRYNTMVVFLYRPSPQVPRPSVSAALKVFEACRYNIYLQREQITLGNVDLTWIFTQAIFMAINCLLWSLSFAEVRKQNPKQHVQKHLETAMDAIRLGSERWPGVLSAIELYRDLIQAILKAYDKDGDIPLNEATPSDSASPGGMPYSPNIGASPGTISTVSIATPPERIPPYTSFHNTSVEHPPPMPYQSTERNVATSPLYQNSPASRQSMPRISEPTISPEAYQQPPTTYFQPLPTNFPEMPVHNNWGSATQYASPLQRTDSDSYSHYGIPASDSSLALPQTYPPAVSSPLYGPGDPAAHHHHQHHQQQQHQQHSAESMMQNQGFWSQDMSQFGLGLDHAQRSELMHSLETSGMEDIQHMITNTMRAFGQRPPPPPPQNG